MGYNSPRNPLFFSAKIDNDTGITTTIAAAGTYVVLADASKLEVMVDNSNDLINLDATTGVYTLSSNPAAAGIYELIADIGNFKGANNALVKGAWHKGSNKQSGFFETKMAATALESNGCARVIVSLAAGDTVKFMYDSGTNGDTVVTKRATFVIKKLADA